MQSCSTLDPSQGDGGGTGCPSPALRREDIDQPDPPVTIGTIAKLLLLAGSTYVFAASRGGRHDRPQDGDALPAAAHETGRGRRADAPSQISARGWRDVVMRVYNETFDDNLWVLAAGVAFYCLLSLFPAIAATVSIYGMVADVGTIEQHLIALGSVMPGEAQSIVEGQVRAVAESSSTALGFGAALTLGFAIWSAASAVKALMAGLTLAYDETERRSFLWYNVVALALTVGAILFLLVSLGAIVVLPTVFAFVGLGATAEAVVGFLRWPALAVLVMVALAAFYRYAPCRSRPRWRWVSWGSVLATATWLAASAGFSWYVSNFGSYNETYGTLGAVVILLMWFYLTAYIVLIGAELNAEMEHQTVRDTTDPPEEALGRRGAYVADTVGERS
jgi:membrane protein